MSKKLEEAISYLKIYKNDISKVNTCETRAKIKSIQTILNYINNSIPIEAVNEKIEDYEKLIKECENDEEHYGEISLYEIYINALQELLEGK